MTCAVSVISVVEDFTNCNCILRLLLLCFIESNKGFARVFCIICKLRFPTEFGAVKKVMAENNVRYERKTLRFNE